MDNILKVVEQIKSSVSKHELSLCDVNKKLDIVSEQLRSLSDRTFSLENRADSIEKRFSDVETKNFSSDETIILEVFERQARFRNLILFSVPENNNSSTNDSVSIKEIFNTLSVNLQPTAISRLGKTTDKPRPMIKLTLPEPADVFTILKAKHGLYSSLNFGNIHNFPDPHNYAKSTKGC